MKIYFDMDGVLADFDSMMPNSAMFNHPSETLSDDMRAQKKQFWREVEKNTKFWHDIPVMPGTEQMLSEFQKHGELFVLSKTPGANKFVGGAEYVKFVADEKRKWIAEHLNKFFDNSHVIICDGNKGALIKPDKDDILVDDRQENIQEWIDCGGHGVLFEKSSNPVQWVKQIIE